MDINNKVSIITGAGSGIGRAVALALLHENVKTFLDAFHPKLVILIKYEFWPNYLIELEKRKITVISASSIFRPSQFLFKSIQLQIKNFGGTFKIDLESFELGTP